MFPLSTSFASPLSLSHWHLVPIHSILFQIPFWSGLVLYLLEMVLSYSIYREHTKHHKCYIVVGIEVDIEVIVILNVIVIVGVVIINMIFSSLSTSPQYITTASFTTITFVWVEVVQLHPLHVLLRHHYYSVPTTSCWWSGNGGSGYSGLIDDEEGGGGGGGLANTWFSLCVSTAEWSRRRRRW